MTGKKDEAIRQQLAHLIQQEGITVTALAKSIGCSRPTLSRYINEESYMNSELQYYAAQYLTSIQGQADNAPTLIQLDPDAFYGTKVALDIFGLCEQCFAQRDMGVIVGESGIGKTTALKKYAATNPAAIYIRANPNLTQKALLRKIGKALELNFDYESIDGMMDKLIEKFSEEPVILLIDEAEYLISNTSQSPMRKLEMLRTLYDETESFGLVLCGMPRFKGYLLKGASMKENLVQFWNRIFRGCEFGGTKREDVQEIMETLQLPLPVQDELVSRALGDGGNMRRFMKLLASTLDLGHKKGVALTKDIVQQADTLLLKW